MKNRLTAMTLAIILFTAVLMSLSCKDVPQNTSNTTANNTAMNANRNNSDQNSESVSTLREDCSGTNEVKIDKVKEKMRQKIRGSDILHPQYREDGSRNFNFDVVDVSGDVVLYIWGFVYTEPEDKVDDLNKTFKKFIKKGCVSKVVFEPPRVKSKTAATGFEFNLCEFPNEICSDGICRAPANCKKDIDTNTNTNTNKAN